MEDLKWDPKPPEPKTNICQICREAPVFHGWLICELCREALIALARRFILEGEEE